MWCLCICLCHFRSVQICINLKSYVQVNTVHKYFKCDLSPNSECFFPPQGVDWQAPWPLPVVMTQCECSRRRRRVILTSLCSPWWLRRPKLTTRTSTVWPGTQRRKDSWPPAAMTETSPSGGSKRKTEHLTPLTMLLLQVTLETVDTRRAAAHLACTYHFNSAPY